MILNKSVFPGCRIGRIRAIFQLPSALGSGYHTKKSPEFWPREPLAYIEWFDKLENAAKKDHMMYRVKKPSKFLQKSSKAAYAIVRISDIRQSCMLFPDFGKQQDRAWQSSTVLDECSSFYINPFQSPYTYQSIY
jgi:hypothetical protein